ncbi:hypothetical protein [Spiroplasma taiwanense]|uniref:hypothetical protein n=1 Tax=Spiroplasma taiwanense TaxID=2145 RepID=UPI0003FAFB82|nr:hypothetical protein [Spiroplasma taiwanense]
MSFQQANEKKLTINFKKNGSEIQIRLPELYDSFYLQKYVNEEKMKYKNISKWINDIFIENQYYLNDFSSDNSFIHNERIDAVLKELGAINTSSKVIKANNLEIRTLTSINSNIPVKWSKGDKVDVELTLNNTFISIEQLEQKILNELNEVKKQILQDLYDFALYIRKEFFDFQKEKTDLFDKYIFLINENNESKMINTSKDYSEITFKKEYLKSIYNYRLDGSYNGDYFTFTDNSVTNLVRNDLNFELMIVALILEQYFIKYTSNYLNAINNSVSISSGDFENI